MVGQEIVLRLKAQNSNGSVACNKLVALSSHRFECVRKQIIDAAHLKGDRSFYTMWMKEPEVLNLAAVATCATEQLGDFTGEKSRLEALLLTQTGHADRSATKARISELERHIKTLDGAAPFASTKIEEIRKELCLPPDMISIPALDQEIFSGLPPEMKSRIMEHPSILAKIERDSKQYALQENNHALSKEEVAKGAVQAFVEAQYALFSKDLPKRNNSADGKFKAAMEKISELFLKNKGILSPTIIKSAFPLNNVVHKGGATSIDYASGEMVVMDLFNQEDPIVIIVGSVQEVGKKYSQDHKFVTSYNAKHDKQAEIFTGLYEAVYGKKKKAD